MKTIYARAVRLLAGVAALTLVSSNAALAQSVAAADQTEIQSIIRMQVDAFLADNSDAAFSFAAPSIKSMFGNEGPCALLGHRFTVGTCWTVPTRSGNKRRHPGRP